jgi:NADPH:quinone reductase
MKALVTGFGGVDDVSWVQVDDVTCRDFELEVEVRATALNRADLLQVCGRYPAPAGVVQNIPGLEYAGYVVRRGALVTKYDVGARVFGLVPGGAFAERLVVHQDEAMAIPDNFDFVKAAAVPEAFITAWDALAQAKVKANEWVLIHAVASGVGTAAVQLVKALGAQVIGTSRSLTKIDIVKSLGLEHGLALSASFASEVQKRSGGGVDVALDLIGGAAFGETLASLKPRGRLVLIGLVAGAEANVPLRTVLGRRLSIFVTVMRTRDHEERVAVTNDFVAAVMPWLRDEIVRPHVDDVMAIADAPRAFCRLAANDTVGKLVLTVER